MSNYQQDKRLHSCLCNYPKKTKGVLMISVQNLTKTYRSKRRSVCHALKNVSFELPDTGLVFVIGKSGSGKSTLLNMIGGLDKITKGKVISFGNDIAKYSSHKLQDYRNTELGFIFQDFHLLDDLTISENIALALELQEKVDPALIEWALEQVDLVGYGERYPSELSGGQKQRVAIARAIVKRPRLLLADEPTGNLDSKTTTQITELLHKISRNTLVLVVSHNLNDAHNYADRILELSEGEIINDLTRDEFYNDEVELIGGTLNLPLRKELTGHQVAAIDNLLALGRIKKLRQKNNQFKNSTPMPLQQDKPANLKSKRLSIKRQLKLSWQFGRSYIFKSITSAIMAAAVLIIICLSQMIMFFDPADVVEREVAKSENLSLAYSRVDTEAPSESGYQPLIAISDSQFDHINSSVDNKAHKFVSYSLYVRAIAPSTYGRENVPSFTSSTAFVSYTFGTVICNEDYLTSIFGKNGKLDITYAEEYNPGGVYITDYIADSIRASYPLKYYDYKFILGKYTPTSSKLQYGYINGIIHTGYADRYQDLMELLKNNKTPLNTLVRENERFAQFYDEVKQYLAVTYSTEADYVTHMANNQTVDVARVAVATLNGVEIPPASSSSTYWCFANDNYFNHTLEDNEIAIDYRLFNQMFGTNYEAVPTNKTTDVVKTVTLSTFHSTDEEKKNPYMTMEVDVRLCTMGNALNISCGSQVLRQANQNLHLTYGVYFDPSTNVQKVSKMANEYGLTPNSIKLASLSTMTRAVEVFSEFFGIIFFVLVAALVILIVKYGLDIVRRKIYEIGVIKALGGRSTSFMIIFGVQVIVFGLMVCLFAQVGMFFIVDLANDVLVKSLQTLATSRIMMDIDILAFNYPLIMSDCIVTFFLCILTTLVPIFALHKIKPINIIKAKE